MRFALLCVALALFVCATQSQDQPLKKKDVPSKVLEAFQKAYPKATVKAYSREVEDGTVRYEIESVQADVHRDVTYLADGSLVGVEESLPFADLPDQVRNAVKKEFPKAKVNLCEKLTEGESTRFEIQLRSGKEKLEVVFEPDGRIVKTEKNP